MEKLELKHIAPYLPFGLIIQREFTDNFGNAESDTVTLVLEDVEFYFLQDNSSEFTSVKPILRPMDKALLEKIASWDERLSVIGDKIHYTDDQLQYFLDFNDYESLEYWLVVALFEEHFDVFGLIEKGLAIDVNLNQEPKKEEA